MQINMDLINIERALITRYRDKLYRKFIKAIDEYDLIKKHDRIAVCISGGKDSLTLAKLFQEIERHKDYNISVKYIAMDPGFTKENLKALKDDCKKLGIPVDIKKSDVFAVSEKLGKDKPCYLCARMRRGFLYDYAQEQGCNKIALGHHFNDVIETILLNVLYGGEYKTMMPKLKAKNYRNMELIRPMVYIEEQDIANYIEYSQIKPMSCGCKFSLGNVDSKRKEVKELISKLKIQFNNVDMNIYRSAENVNIDYILGYKKANKKHLFLETYEDRDN